MDESHSKNQARAQLESIVELIKAKRQASKTGEVIELEEGYFFDENDILERIQNDPLSIEVRSDWVVDGHNMQPSEFSILLCTGGPAVRIIGRLDQHKQPDSATIQHQDWGIPWTDYNELNEEQEELLLEYCRYFFFGE